MNKKSQKAIKSLESHLQKLSEIKTVQEGNSWKATLKDMLNKYIGSDSSIVLRLDDLYFTRKEIQDSKKGILGTEFKHIYDESNKKNFIHLIENAKSFIRENGIYQNPSKRNFLSGFDNKTIVGGIIAGASLIYGIGHYLGSLEKERESIKMERELTTQKETISKLNKDIEKLKIENRNLRSSEQPENK